jgi:hypothetical protein
MIVVGDELNGRELRAYPVGQALIEEECRQRAMAAQVYPDLWPPKGLGERARRLGPPKADQAHDPEADRQHRPG